MRARPLLVLIALAAPALAGCVDEAALDSASASTLPRTPEGFVVVEEWAKTAVVAGESYEFAFEVPARLRFIDLDTRVEMAGGSWPTVRFYYVTPAGEEVAATAQDGSGLNGREIASPGSGAWTLKIDGAQNQKAFTIRMWLYGCEEGVDCRVFVPPKDEHRHG